MDWDVIAALLIFVVLAATGAIGGLLLARRRLASNVGDNPDEIKLGAWTTNKLAGSSAANALTRARIAIHGILAMHRQETIYFFALQDDLGNPLDPDRDWEIRGRGFDCRWWSFTLYDEEYQLIDSPSRRYSVHSDNVVPEVDGSYRIVISREDGGANWLATGAAKKLMVTIRLYNPSQAVLDDVAGVKLPQVRRMEKGRAAA
jgi:hypothetical protein